MQEISILFTSPLNSPALNAYQELIIYLLVELVFVTSFHLAPSKRKPHQYDGRVALSNVFIWPTARDISRNKTPAKPRHKDKLRRSLIAGDESKKNGQAIAKDTRTHSQARINRTRRGTKRHVGRRTGQDNIVDTKILPTLTA